MNDLGLTGMRQCVGLGERTFGYISLGIYLLRIGINNPVRVYSTIYSVILP